MKILYDARILVGRRPNHEGQRKQQKYSKHRDEHTITEDDVEGYEQVHKSSAVPQSPGNDEDDFKTRTNKRDLNYYDD